MIDYLIIGIAAAGLELVYQRLLFPGHPLHKWFLFLFWSKWKIRHALGLCHFCNSVWVSILIHFLLIGANLEVLITIGVCMVVLSLLLPVKWLIYVP
jgi:hypothetical protein